MTARCPACGLDCAPGTTVCPVDGHALAAVDPNDDPLASGPTRLRGGPELNPRLDDAAVSTLLTGRTLGDYRVGAFLGAGGMCEVYTGEHTVIRKQVAIKVLKPELATDAEVARRMLTEAQAVSAIHHRGIVDISHFGSLPDGRPYLVMEHLSGESLDLTLQRRKPFPPREACELLEQVAAALAAAHAVGVVHRDVKPANVFIVEDPRTHERSVKLLDFGLAKLLQPTGTGPHTQVGLVLGTPDYLAPEQARGAAITPQTDLYSLGATAFEVLTGRVVFQSPHIAQLLMDQIATPAPRPSSVVAGIPRELDDLVLQLLAKDPADRPASAEAVRREFKRLQSAPAERGAQSPSATPDSPRAPAAPGEPRAWQWAAVFAAALALGAGVVLALSPTPGTEGVPPPRPILPPPPHRDVAASPPPRAAPVAEAPRAASPAPRPLPPEPARGEAERLPGQQGRATGIAPTPEVSWVPPADRAETQRQVDAAFDLLRQGNDSEAERVLLGCVERDPYSAACHEGLGILKARRFDDAAAIEEYEMFLELAPQDQDAPDARAAIAAIKARGKKARGKK